MKTKILIIVIALFLLSQCNNEPKEGPLSEEQLSAYSEGYARGWAAGCYEVFRANIGGGTLYSGNVAVSYDQCMNSMNQPNFDNPSLHSDMSVGWFEDEGFPNGVGGAFDFAFKGGRSLCYGEECITEDSILSNLG